MLFQSLSVHLKDFVIRNVEKIYGNLHFTTTLYAVMRITIKYGIHRYKCVKMGRELFLH